MTQSPSSTIGIIVDKSKATKSVRSTVSAFPADSYILKRHAGKSKKYRPKHTNFLAFLTALFT